MALLLGHGVASVAPGSQWAAKWSVAFAILCLGLLMMVRLKRLELALAWIGGFVVMGLARMALGQGGLVFALGPMTARNSPCSPFRCCPTPKPLPRLAAGESFGGCPSP